ncbi:MAG: Succinate-semialdehyde dehydrogenase [Devosia sp.]|uniref:NAD-dependent succinate-semialdehyde dehydrogenase n=1 Tax=Devosia sp. TaxID=1871048 RepID=UPI00262B9BA6|nr:NAD-dependent succinate-semialdehyde dehydrogenase [Devosia sp.]MDB5585121.1 Succinate-semialdehyde dehydrogenase [Devosia sp.]
MTFKSINPATGVMRAEFSAHPPAEVERLLEQAWTGWRAWAATTMEERSAFLVRLAELLEARADDYAALITGEMGKPVGEARGEVIKAATGARHFAEAGPRYLAEEPIVGTPSSIIYEPMGPIFGVMPWNLPFWQVLRFFIPAAIAGNVVLVKHADLVQGSAQAIEDLVRDAGGPAGLYTNLRVRRDAVSGIIADPRVRAVTVTGSTGAGRAVAEAAGAHGKKAVLELGGSDPYIVFEDADFDKAVSLGIVSRFSNNAQSCIAAKRFLIAAPIFDAYCAAFAKAASALVIGDPMDPTTKLGPLAKADLVETTTRQIADAVAAGGRIIAGGKAMAGLGNFFEPTVIVGVDPTAPIASEEFFGPVALMFPFTGEADAIAQANATDFGLGGAVWTRDPERARRVVRQMEAGAIFINDFVRSDPRAPFGGVKGSGFGRELGPLGARELTNAKLVWTGA